MFKVVIAGRTMLELRSNVVAYLNGMDDFTEPSQPSQPVVPPPSDVPKIPASEEISPKNSPTIPFTPSILPSVLAPSTPVPVPAPSVSKAAESNEFGLDSRGLPWDARIHAVTQGVNKDGSWRNRRGVEPSLVAQVENELRARSASAGIPNGSYPAPQPVSTPIVAPPLPPPIIPFSTPVPATPLTIVAPPPVVAPQPAPVPAPTPTVPSSVAALPAAYTLATFREHLVPALSKLVQDGKLTREYVRQLKEYFKVDQIWNVNEQQLGEMFEQFAAAGLLVKVG